MAIERAGGHFGGRNGTTANNSSIGQFAVFIQISIVKTTSAAPHRQTPVQTRFPSLSTSCAPKFAYLFMVWDQSLNFSADAAETARGLARCGAVASLSFTTVTTPKFFS